MDRKLTDDLGFHYSIAETEDLLSDITLAKIRHEAALLAERAPRRPLAREYADLSVAAERLLAARALLRESAKGREPEKGRLTAEIVEE